MIDTHAHLNFPEFDGRVADVLASCRRAGIAEIVVPGTNLNLSARAISCATQYSNVYAAVGIHPGEIFSWPVGDTDALRGEIDRQMEELERLACSSDRVVAIGEIGLDRYQIIRTFGAFRQDILDVQVALFEAQLELARRLDKAVIIHSRESADDLMAVLERHWSPARAYKMVIHCCEADVRLIKFAIDRDMYIGVDGDVTFIKKKQEFIRLVPLNRLVLETDSPFLTPSPIREQAKYPNSPEHLVHICEKVADLLSLSSEEVDRATTENAQRLFGIGGK